MNTILKGIFAPLLTPYDKDGTVNYQTYTKLAKYVTENGVAGVFVCGTTGEFVNLTLEEREGLLDAALKGVKPGTVVMNNITAFNLKDVQWLIDMTKEHGVNSVSITAPVFHHYDAAALIKYFIKIGQMTKGLNYALYNIPGFTHNPITPNILKAVKAKCENLFGVKDSSMDYMTFLNYQLAIPKNFEIVTGNDAQVLTSLMAGADGAIIAAANVFPKIASGIYSNFKAGNLAEAKKYQDKVILLREMFRRIMPIMTHKECLKLLGMDMGPARIPMRDLTKEEKQDVAGTLRNLEFL